METDLPKRIPQYRQMILTLWQEDRRSQTSTPRWRLSLHNPHIAERTGFQEVEELAAFLQAWMEEQGVKREGIGDWRLEIGDWRPRFSTKRGGGSRGYLPLFLCLCKCS